MWDWLTKLNELRADFTPCVLLNIVEVKGSAPRELGARMIVVSREKYFGTIGGGHLEALAIEEAERCLADVSTKVIVYPLAAKTGQCCGGEVKIFFEPQNVGPELFIFGAGHVGQAVSQVMEGTPFRVHLIDERPEWINSPLIPKTSQRHAVEWESVVRDISWNRETSYAVIMTHRHDRDQDLVEYLLNRPLKYLGLIGSQAKWERFKQRLSLRESRAQDLAKVHCPLGLDTGGKAPKEVAISLAAELLSLYYKKRES